MLWRIWIRSLKSCEVAQSLSAKQKKPVARNRMVPLMQIPLLMIQNGLSSNALWGHKNGPHTAPDKHCCFKLGCLWWLLSLKWYQNSKWHPSRTALSSKCLWQRHSHNLLELFLNESKWNLFQYKGQQRRAPEEGQSEGAPTNATLRSSVRSHLWSDTTLCPPRNPSFWNGVTF